MAHLFILVNLQFTNSIINQAELLTGAFIQKQRRRIIVLNLDTLFFIIKAQTYNLYLILTLLLHTNQII